MDEGSVTSGASRNPAEAVPGEGLPAAGVSPAGAAEAFPEGLGAARTVEETPPMWGETGMGPACVAAVDGGRATSDETGVAHAPARWGWRRSAPDHPVPTGCRRVVLPFVGFVVDADDDHRRRVERFFQVPMLILSLLVLPLIAAHHYFSYYLVNAGLVDMVDIAFVVMSVVFLVEFMVKVTVARSRLQYCLANWLDIVIIALPFLRPLRAARVARVAQMTRAYSLRGVYVKVVRTGVAFVLGTEYVRRMRERREKGRQESLADPHYERWSRAALIAEIGRLKERLAERERGGGGEAESGERGE